MIPATKDNKLRCPFQVPRLNICVQRKIRYGNESTSKCLFRVLVRATATEMHWRVRASFTGSPAGHFFFRRFLRFLNVAVPTPGPLPPLTLGSWPSLPSPPKPPAPDNVAGCAAVSLNPAYEPFPLATRVFPEWSRPEEFELEEDSGSVSVVTRTISAEAVPTSASSCRRVRPARRGGWRASSCGRSTCSA